MGPSSGGSRASGFPLALTLLRNLLLLHCITMCAEILFSHGLLQDILVRRWSIFLDLWRPRWVGSPFGPLSRRVPPSLSLPLFLSPSLTQSLNFWFSTPFLLQINYHWRRGRAYQLRYFVRFSPGIKGLPSFTIMLRTSAEKGDEEDEGAPGGTRGKRGAGANGVARNRNHFNQHFSSSFIFIVFHSFLSIIYLFTGLFFQRLIFPNPLHLFQFNSLLITRAR